MDQTSASASKPGPPNQAVTLDPPPPRPQPTSHSVEAMEVDYGPSLPPRLSADHDNASDQHSSLSNESTKVASARPEKHCHFRKKHDIEPRFASDQYSGQSDEPRVASSRPKKHADRIKHKVRSRYHMCLHLQRRISPLHPDTGLQSPLGLILIKTNLNTIQTHLIIGK